MSGWNFEQPVDDPYGAERALQRALAHMEQRGERAPGTCIGPRGRGRS